MIYYINAYTTLISAALDVCFFNRGCYKRKRKQPDKRSVYARQKPCFNVCRSRSCCRNAPAILFVITATMLIVQIVNCIIGIVIKSKMRTVGPFIMAVCHAVCLLLSI